MGRPEELVKHQPPRGRVRRRGRTQTRGRHLGDPSVSRAQSLPNPFRVLVLEEGKKNKKSQDPNVTKRGTSADILGLQQEKR